MLRLSKKLLFAIEAVVDIAYHAGPGPVRSTDISKRQGIPRRYLEQVLQELVRKGVLSGQRGPRGGYRLARERRRITVGQIVRVVRELECASDPVSESNDSEIGVKVVRPIWSEIQDELMSRFDALTVEELCNRARAQNIASQAAQVPDFSI
jgi:Rrf2 family protein